MERSPQGALASLALTLAAMAGAWADAGDEALQVEIDWLHSIQTSQEDCRNSIAACSSRGLAFRGGRRRRAKDRQLALPELIPRPG